MIFNIGILNLHNSSLDKVSSDQSKPTFKENIYGKHLARTFSVRHIKVSEGLMIGLKHKIRRNNDDSFSNGTFAGMLTINGFPVTMKNSLKH